MISREFKVFLLILLFFGALMAYRYRSRDIGEWLGLGSSLADEPGSLADMRSHVNRVIDPERDSPALARLYIREPRLEVEPLESILADPPPDRAEEGDVEGEEVPRGGAAGEAASWDGDRGVGTKTTGQREKEKETKRDTDTGTGKPGSDHRGASGPGAPQPDAGDVKGSNPSGEEPSRSEKRDPHKAPADGRKRPARKDRPLVARDTGEADSAGGKTVKHVVRRNDTLTGISLKYYNTSKSWRRIYTANRGKISDPNRIKVGLVLSIPNVESKSQPKSRKRNA